MGRPRQSELPLSGLQERLPLPAANGRRERRDRLSRSEPTDEIALAECSPAHLQEHYRRLSKESYYGDEFDHLFLPGVLEMARNSRSHHESDITLSPEPEEDRKLLDMPIDAASLRRIAAAAPRAA